MRRAKILVVDPKKVRVQGFEFTIKGLGCGVQFARSGRLGLGHTPLIVQVPSNCEYCILVRNNYCSAGFG